MSATVQGTAHLYGVDGTITSATVNSFSDKGNSANTGKVENEVGNVIERRYDDETHDSVVEITLREGYTIPSPKGTLFTYNAVDYEITSIDQKQVKKGYQMLTLNLTRSELITPA